MKVESVLESLYTKLSILAKLPSTTPVSVRSKSRDAILTAIDEFIISLEEQCSLLSHEIPELELEIRTALSDLLDTSQIFQLAVGAFTADPMDEQKAAELNRAGSALVASLNRLLIVVELADSTSLEELIEELKQNIQDIVATTSPKDLTKLWDSFHRRYTELVKLLNDRSVDSLNPDYGELNSKVQYILSTNSPLLHSTSKICINHPDNMAAKGARQFASDSLMDALQTAQDMLDDNPTVRLKFCGKLLDEFESFENSGVVDVVDGIDEKQIHTRLRQHLNSVLPSVYRLADAASTRPEHQRTVYAQCEHLQQSLNSLLTEFGRKPLNHPELDDCMQSLLNRTGVLKHQLMRICVHHVVDTLYDRDQPLMALSDATKFGNPSRMDDVSQVFENHTASMVKATYDLCSLTSNEDAARKVQLACTQLEQLSSQVINTAYSLFKYPHSRSIESTFSTFCRAYEKATELLLSSFIKMTSIHDISAAIDDQMSHDFKSAAHALSVNDDSEFQRITASMQRRAVHLVDLVRRHLQLEADNADYVNRVTETLILLKDEHALTFTEVSRETLSQMGAAPQTRNLSKFDRAGNGLCDAVHSIRMAILNGTDLPSELDALRPTNLQETFRPCDTLTGKTSASERLMNNEFQRTVDSAFAFLNPDQIYVNATPKSSPSLTTGSDEMSGGSGKSGKSGRPNLYHVLSKPECEAVAQEVAGFLEEKDRFMREVVMWDDSSNDVVLLAKQMCAIMMEMADFAQGKGPLQTTMEMIQCAQHISELGSKLDKLCRDIANTSPDSEGRRDLLAYLQRITLHCHQLRITSKVKSEVQGSTTELAESTTALLQAARNLMNAVVLTVKQSYILSTKYRNPHRQSIISWQMHAPGMKPLTQLSPSATQQYIMSNSLVRRPTDALTQLEQFDRQSPATNPRSSRHSSGHN